MFAEKILLAIACLNLLFLLGELSLNIFGVMLPAIHF